MHVTCLPTSVKIAIKRELGLLRNSLLDYTYQSSSISKATPTFKATPISACSTGMNVIPAISDHTSKSCLSGKLRPLSLPKPTIILPFSHSKTMTILKDGHMKPVTLLACIHCSKESNIAHNILLCALLNPLLYYLSAIFIIQPLQFALPTVLYVLTMGMINRAW